MRFVPLLLALFLTPSLAAQTVHVVDAAGGPGSHFTTIGAAVTAAVDGDILLIRDGDYPEIVVIDGKELSLQRDPAGTAVVVTELHVINLAADQHVSIRGMNLGQIHPTYGPAVMVTLQDNLGPVWLEELTLQDFFFASDVPMRVQDCASVVLSNFTLGNIVMNSGTDAPIDLIGSTVHMHDSNLGTITLFVPPEGAPGILVNGGKLTVTESTVTGGYGLDGVSGHGGCFNPGGDGGPAIRVTGGAKLVLQEVDLIGGLGGCGSPPGGQGPPYDLASGTLKTAASPARTHANNSPIREGGMVQATVEGEPGDLVFVYISFTPGLGLSGPAWDGAFVLQPQLFKVRIGVLPPSGVINASFPIGELGPGVQGLTLYLQGVFWDMTTPRIVLSEPTAQTLLDGSF